MLYLENLVNNVFECATQHPEWSAITVDNITTNYGQLSLLIKSVEEELNGVGLDQNIICFNPNLGVQTVASILGIWLANKTPLAYPKNGSTERIQKILETSGASVEIVWQDNIPVIQNLNTKSSRGIIQTFQCNISPAYLLFTSGSTGIPKGVLFPNESLSMLADWHSHHSWEKAIIMSVAPFTFDVSYQSLVAFLSVKGHLILPTDNDRKDPKKLVNLMSSNHVEFIFLPPVLLIMISEFLGLSPVSLEKLRHVYVAGEKLRITPKIRTLFAFLKNCRLHNHYGPTETHVVTSLTLPENPLDWPDLPSIGFALPNVKTRIVNSKGWECKTDEVGELLIGGPRVAYGYINTEGQNSDNFFIEKGEKWYRTGDLVSKNQDEFQYHGRNDRQVKISGHRVEPAEIEVVLNAHPNIVFAIITEHKTAQNNSQVVAYLQLKDGYIDTQLPARITSPPWKEDIESKLPSYLIPSIWIVVDGFVTNNNGKVDYKALPNVKDVSIETVSKKTPFANDVVKSLQNIWGDILGLDNVPQDVSFFDLGGNSLNAMRLSMRLSELFDCSISPLSIFEHPTIEEFTGFLCNNTKPIHVTNNKDLATHQNQFAIVGMSCRFPGAESLSEYWTNIDLGIDSITRADVVDHNDFVAATGLIKDVDCFDSKLFNIPSEEASMIDPQHRKFLECTWEALEDAGINPTVGGTDISIFGGCGPSSYLLNNLHSVNWRADRSLLDSAFEMLMLIGNDKDFFTSRVAYTLNLGKSYNVNAACATSLVAVHLACEELKTMHSNVAIAGAACIPTPQLRGHTYELNMPFSQDGYCRPFDKEASGTVFGSGVGVVVLKRLDDAIRDKDDIYAVIRGSAVNNDGSTKSGIAAPSVKGQERVIRSALESSGIKSHTIDYVEAHGTGTLIGDPIEVEALNRAYNLKTTRTCGIGSVKSNIGHLGWSAGMAGLIKSALALYHRKVPKTLNFNQENPLLNLKKTPFFIVSEPLYLNSVNKLHRIGVSAFGVGGSNAHIILEQATPIVENPQPIEDLSEGSYLPVPFSALDSGALERKLVSFLNVERCKNTHINDIVLTLGEGRPQLKERLVAIAKNSKTLCSALESKDFLTSFRETKAPHTVALFSGHGSEYKGMAQSLYHTYDIFKNSIDTFTSIVHEETGKNLTEILFTDSISEPIQDVVEAHIAVYTVGVALYDFMKSLGIKFDSIIGHSLGEYPAAAAAGVFNRLDGLKIVIERGRLIELSPKDGSMAIVRSSSDQVEKVLSYCSKEVGIAVFNTHSNTVISGPINDLNNALKNMQDCGLNVTPLNAMRAGHSVLMQPIKDKFINKISTINFSDPEIPLFSNLTGKLFEKGELNASYLGEHLCNPVQFKKSLRLLDSLEFGTFIELGGHSILLGMVAEELADENLLLVPLLNKKSISDQTFAQAIGKLYCDGYNLNWNILAGKTSRKTHMPGYIFAKDRHWIEPAKFRVSNDTLSFNEKHSHAKDCGYINVWRQCELNKQSHNALKGKCFIIYDTKTSFITNLILQLEQKSADITVIDATIPIVEENIESSFHKYDTVNVLFFVNHLSMEKFKSSDIDGFDSLIQSICLVTTWMRILSRWVEPGRFANLWQITNGAWQVTPDDIVDPFQSAFASLSKNALIELKEINCISLDLHPSPSNNCIDLLVGKLIDQSMDKELAIRSNTIFCKRLESWKVNHKHIKLIDKGINLITGGLGGIGLKLADELILRGATHIVLASRKAPSEEKLLKIEKLRKKGAVVDSIILDVSNNLNVNQWFDDTLSHQEKIIGIYHLAGALSDKSIMDLTKHDFETTLFGKAKGAWNLHQACDLHNIEPQEFVLFSSASAVTGNIGQSNYIVANAFLDGLAYYRSSLGKAALSINWGVWGDIGHVTHQPKLQSMLNQQGMGTLSSHSCFTELFNILNENNPKHVVQVGFLANHWERYLSFNGLENIPFFESLHETQVQDNQQSVGSLFTILSSLSKNEQTTYLIDWISKAISRFTPNGKSPDINVNLRESNLDSLSLIQLKNHLRKELHLDLPSQLIERYQTIENISKFIVSAIDKDVTKKISQVEPLEFIPITVQQKRWLLLNTKLNYGHRVVPVIFKLPLKPDILRQTVVAVVSRHPILQCIYPDNYPKFLDPEQVVPNTSNLLRDIRHKASKQPLYIAEEVQNMRKCVPDPHTIPSWQIRCLWIDSSCFMLLIGAQHLELDGTGLSVFVDEINTLYRKEIYDMSDVTLPEVIPYSEYAFSQKKYLSKDIEKDREFFKGLFSSVNSLTTLPNTPTLKDTVALPSKRFTPTESLGDRSDFIQIQKDLNVSFIAIILASYAKLISEMTNDDTVVISLIRSSRNEERFARTIGPLTMPFPVPIQVGCKSLIELIPYCNKIIDHIMIRADYPSIDLINTVESFKDLPYYTYFSDFGLNFTNYRAYEKESGTDVEIVEVLSDNPDSKFKSCDFDKLTRVPGFHIVLQMSDTTIRAHYWYHTDRISYNDIIKWTKRHKQIIKDIIEYK